MNLAQALRRLDCAGMPFLVSADEHRAIREAFETGGEAAAVAALLRQLPGLGRTDEDYCARIALRIAAWESIPPVPRRSRRWRRLLGGTNAG